ncbi:UNVERIFIED_CONTAM: hypothetical protein B566_EDAN019010, partial [Ephemera danica]
MGDFSYNYRRFGYGYVLVWAQIIKLVYSYDVILEDISGQYSTHDYRGFRQGFRLFLVSLNALATTFLIINRQLVKYRRRLVINNDNSCFLIVITSIFIGVGFICFQIFEYRNLYYSICDRTFGSIFFLGTGIHGSHVFV